MTLGFKNDYFSTMVDAQKGLVDRRIFSDEDIYQQELEHIFARAWLFMCHDSQIPNPGDFFMTYMGEDRVIVVRDNEGNPQVLVNSCRHRGNAVCRAEEGHATSFMCTYHGWAYDLKGALVGVPGFKEVYHEELDRENWGLIKAAQVDTYKGFVFATMDPEAPTLDGYLGKIGRMGLDVAAERGPLKAAPGIQKYIIGCNWKLAADNVWDWYHPSISHASSVMTNWRRNSPPPKPQKPGERWARPHLVTFGEYGHCFGGPQWTPDSAAGEAQPDWREREGVAEEVGPVGMRFHQNAHPQVFPNMWLTFPGGSIQVSMRMPKGPTTTEIWWFTFIDQSLPAENQNEHRDMAIHVFGPAGFLEQDDGENWAKSTRAMTGVMSQKYALSYAMDVGRGQIIDDESGVPTVETLINEHPQLWYYRAWADWMSADSWPDLRANHTPLPTEPV